MVINIVLELARKKKLTGLIACVDFKGAFDSIRHQAVWDTLRHMNVGPRMIGLLQTLYNKSNSAVLNFGTKTTFFDLQRRCRQGDPVAAHLFILVLEVLLTRIRRLVKGLDLDQGNLVALAFADDLTIFVEDNSELQKALRIIENFKEGSGLAINQEKSEILELNMKATTIGIPVHEVVKITGVRFCLDKQTINTKNWEAVLTRVKTLLNSWRQRYLTEIGRINIIKAQILPIITFVGASMALPESYEKLLNTEIFRFLWNAKSEKERRLLCVKKKSEGGLEVPHIASRL